MKTPKTVQTILCATIALLAVAEPESHAQQPEGPVELQRIIDMTEVLKNHGLRRLAQEVRQTSAPPLLIHSPYWVDRNTTKDREARQVETAKVEFGLRLSQSLDSHEEGIQRQAPSSEHIASAQLLFNLSDWLRKAEGYGNYFLSCRCHSLAALSLGYLIADPTTAPGPIERLLKLLPSDRSDTPYRVAVIKRECPVALEISADSEPECQHQELEKFWGGGLTKLKEWCLAHQVPLLPLNRGKRNLLPEELAFFCDDDDDVPQPVTTTSNWLVKRHAVVVLGGTWDANIRAVKSLWLFRQKVGAFPTQPPAWYKSGDSFFTPTSAAFDAAWSPYRKEFGNHDGAAAEVYELIGSGRFFSQDGRAARAFFPASK